MVERGERRETGWRRDGGDSGGDGGGGVGVWTSVGTSLSGGGCGGSSPGESGSRCPGRQCSPWSRPSGAESDESHGTLSHRQCSDRSPR